MHSKFRFLVLGLLAIGWIAFLQSPSHAEEGADANCRLIVDAKTGKVLVKQGPCDVQRTPCSTFKFPLALMGYDAGILKNEHEPKWDYLPEYDGNREEEKQAIDPTSWESISVLWYSRKLVKLMGSEKFESYVNKFDYGNKDISGDPGKDNGLTQSWVMSSLKISPLEQLAFVQKFMKRELGVSEYAYEMTEKILPKFEAEDGWIIQGKTGSGFQFNDDGSWNRKLHEGWFVGWATQGERKVIIIETTYDTQPSTEYAGLRSRARIIKELPGVMKGLGEKKQ